MICQPFPPLDLPAPAMNEPNEQLVPREETIFRSEHMIPVDPTETIQNHPLYIHFLKWLGDLAIPIDRRNYPKMFDRFMELWPPC